MKIICVIKKQQKDKEEGIVFAVHYTSGYDSYMIHLCSLFPWNFSFQSYVGNDSHVHINFSFWLAWRIMSLRNDESIDQPWGLGDNGSEIFQTFHDNLLWDVQFHAGFGCIL